MYIGKGVRPTKVGENYFITLIMFMFYIFYRIKNDKIHNNLVFMFRDPHPLFHSFKITFPLKDPYSPDSLKIAIFSYKMYKQQENEGISLTPLEQLCFLYLHLWISSFVMKVVTPLP